MEEISTMMVRSALPGKSLMSAPSSTAMMAESLQGSTMRSSLTSSDVSPIRMSSEDSMAAVTAGGLRKTVSILAIAPTKMQVPSETAGATVFVGAGGTSCVAATNGAANTPANWRQTSIPEVESVNGYGTRQHQQDNQKELKQQLLQVTSVVGTGTPQQQRQQQSSPSHQSGQHVVKIRINPELETSRVISTVRLNPELTEEGSVSAVKSSVKQSFNENNGKNIERDDSSGETDVWTRRDNAVRLSGLGVTNEAAGQSETRVRISVVSSCLGSERNNENQRHVVEKSLSLENREASKQQDEMIQQCATTNETINGSSINRGSACFYYGSFPNSLTSMMTSSGQCSPSDTLDSGTCSDLDGTPPPLPKKKNSSTVLLGVNGGSSVIGKTIGNVASQKGQHNRTGSVTSSGAELDSDDNESNISCDSLNSGDLASRIIEHQSVRVNGIALVGSADNIAKPDSHEKTNNGEGHRDAENSRVTSGDEVSVKNVDMKLDNHHHQIIDENEHTDDLQNNNNTSKNNNNNLSKNEDNDTMSLNGSKVIVDEEMNERNNGKAEVTTDTAILPSELISPSSSASTSVSPSPSGASSLSKASSTPRVRSPVSNGRSSPLSSSPMVKECTYEERKRDQDRINEESAAADYYANYNRKNGTKYLYDDDRFYKFHINENQSDNENDEDAKIEDKESDEFFAGYKILDREAIRSAKGTVRGVKNRVRAGIATFLQKSSTKNYKIKDAGKVVVYVTSMSIVRKTFFACLKVLQILRTHMVQHDVRDLFMSRELQTELKERIGCEHIEVPQLFIDGQLIGNADAVERLNESGELRRMFKPYKSPNSCITCTFCGGCRLLPCQVCKGSKKSPVRNDFMKEFYFLKCMNCDEVGLVRCTFCQE